MISKPKWREIREVTDLGSIIGDDSYNGTGGVVFTAEKGVCFAYLASINNRVQYVIPICNEEYAFSTVAEAAACDQLMHFAVGEGMFPRFADSIALALNEFIDDNLAMGLMNDRDGGDIAPEQVFKIKEHVREIADVLVDVWNQNSAKKVPQVGQ